MPALPADVAAATRDALLAEWSDGGLHGRYPSARDGLTDPSTGYFDTLADALVAIAARGALIGVDGRRRFSVVVQDLVFVDPTTGMPCVSLTDAEQSVAATLVLTRIEVDLEAETTTLELFG
jgi:hypothetical protein